MRQEGTLALNFMLDESFDPLMKRARLFHSMLLRIL